MELRPVKLLAFIINLFLLQAIMIMMAFSSRAALARAIPTSSCGVFSAPEFDSHPENFSLKFRKNNTQVSVSAINCRNYEDFLEQEAAELVAQIERLNKRLKKKVVKLDQLRNGELKSKKLVTSTFSCDQRTSRWKPNRQARFRCAEAKSETKTNQPKTNKTDLTKANKVKVTITDIDDDLSLFSRAKKSDSKGDSFFADPRNHEKSNSVSDSEPKLKLRKPKSASAKSRNQNQVPAPSKLQRPGFDQNVVEMKHVTAVFGSSDGSQITGTTTFQKQPIEVPIFETQPRPSTSPKFVSRLQATAFSN